MQPQNTDHRYLGSSRRDRLLSRRGDGITKTSTPTFSYTALARRVCKGEVTRRTLLLPVSRRRSVTARLSSKVVSEEAAVIRRIPVRSGAKLRKSLSGLGAPSAYAAVMRVEA